MSSLAAGPERVPPRTADLGLREEIIHVAQQRDDLRLARSAKVAELTRLSEALASARARAERCEAQVERMARGLAGRGSRRAELTAKLKTCQQLKVELRQRCVDLQAADPGPASLLPLDALPADMRPLIERAAASSAALQQSEHHMEEYTREIARLRALRVEDSHQAELLESKLAVLTEVYSRADDALSQDQPSHGRTEDAAAEVAVLALAKLVLPLVNFSDAQQAVQQLRLMSKNKRPSLMPSMRKERDHSPALLPKPVA